MTVTNEDLAEQTRQLTRRVDDGFKGVHATLDEHKRRFLHLEGRETERHDAELIAQGRRAAAQEQTDQVFRFTWKQASVILSAIGVATAVLAALIPVLTK